MLRKSWKWGWAAIININGNITKLVEVKKILQIIEWN